MASRANSAHSWPSDGAITLAMIQLADRLRAEQRATFPEDSADLIREIREDRDAQL
jgi:hypothetical protein